MKRNKFGNKPFTDSDGIRWDSIAEHKRWCELKLLEKAGEITHLKRQVPIVLFGPSGPLLSRKSGRARKMVLDFSYMTAERRVFEDTKGVETKDWALKADLLANQYPNVDLMINGRKA